MHNSASQLHSGGEKVVLNSPQSKVKVYTLSRGLCVQDSLGVGRSEHPNTRIAQGEWRVWDLAFGMRGGDFDFSVAFVMRGVDFDLSLEVYHLDPFGGPFHCYSCTFILATCALCSHCRVEHSYLAYRVAMQVSKHASIQAYWVEEVEYLGPYTLVCPSKRGKGLRAWEVRSTPKTSLVGLPKLTA